MTDKGFKILQKEELNAVLFFCLFVVLEMYAKLKDQMKNRRSAPFISFDILANVV